MPTGHWSEIPQPFWHNFCFFWCCQCQVWLTEETVATEKRKKKKKNSIVITPYSMHRSASLFFFSCFQFRWLALASSTQRAGIPSLPHKSCCCASTIQCSGGTLFSRLVFAVIVRVLVCSQAMRVCVCARAQEEKISRRKIVQGKK